MAGDCRNFFTKLNREETLRKAAALAHTASVLRPSPCSCRCEQDFAALGHCIGFGLALRLGFQAHPSPRTLTASPLSNPFGYPQCFLYHLHRRSWQLCGTAWASSGAAAYRISLAPPDPCLHAVAGGAGGFAALHGLRPCAAAAAARWAAGRLPQPGEFEVEHWCSRQRPTACYSLTKFEVKAHETNQPHGVLRGTLTVGTAFCNADTVHALCCVSNMTQAGRLPRTLLTFAGFRVGVAGVCGGGLPGGVAALGAVEAFLLPAARPGHWRHRAAHPRHADRQGGRCHTQTSRLSSMLRYWVCRVFAATGGWDVCLRLDTNHQ